MQDYGFFHVDGINGVPSIPCTHDKNHVAKWEDFNDGALPFRLWFGEDKPRWDRDFEMLDGITGNMRDGRCTREQIDER